MSDRTNVLFIAVDDLRPQLGCYGDPDAISPHIDAIAANGTVFDRAYCQQAVCNPSRASLMTGLRPDRLRVWDLQTLFRDTCPDVVTLPQHFKDHGYHAECIGKIYHDPRSHQDERSWSVPELLAITSEVRGKYVLEENLRTYQPNGVPGKEKAAATECADVLDNAYIDGRVADCAVERLAHIAELDKPFFLAVGFRRPHLPFSSPKMYWDLQHPERVAIIANPLPPEDVPQIALHNWQELRGYTDIPDLGEMTAEKSAHLRHGYYAAISYVDAQIGKLMTQLSALGLADNTVVCLWGDHGWHLGEHALWGKTTNFELDTRSPLIISSPGQSSAGATSTSLVEFIDVYPTLVDLCELPQPSDLAGKSVARLLSRPGESIKEYALSQYPRPNRMGYSIRSDNFRYTEWIDLQTKQPRERELYDHAGDPLETKNLANQDQYQDVIDALHPALHNMIDPIPD